MSAVSSSMVLCSRTMIKNSTVMSTSGKAVCIVTATNNVWNPQQKRREYYHRLPTNTDLLRKQQAHNNNAMTPFFMSESPTTPSKRLLSSSSSESSTASSWKPTDMYNNRKERQQKEQMEEQLNRMATKVGEWTISDFGTDLGTTANAWSANYMPFVRSSTEVKMAKETYKHVNGLTEIMGENATIDNLLSMNKKQKLLAASAGETTVEDLNHLIDQFGSMALIQRVLRKRYLQGKPLPEDQKQLQSLVKNNAMKCMSKAQIERQKKVQMKRQKFKR